METKQLDYIHDIVTRLSGNSFQMKAWNVALAAAAIGFAASKDSKPGFAVLGFVPSLAFWGLDAYYLGLERLYRRLYELAIVSPNPSLNLNAGALGRKNWFAAAMSASVVGLHAPMLAVVLTVSLLRFFASAPK
jgi:hypothetical protein